MDSWSVIYKDQYKPTQWKMTQSINNLIQIDNTQKVFKSNYLTQPKTSSNKFLYLIRYNYKYTLTIIIINLNKK